MNSLSVTTARAATPQVPRRPVENLVRTVPPDEVRAIDLSSAPAPKPQPGPLVTPQDLNAINALRDGGTLKHTYSDTLALMQAYRRVQHGR